jgi:ribosomal protein L11 methyltransferase
VLDLGCGSGVLAVVSLVLGAERAFAVDVDGAALDATRGNAEAAGVSGRLAVSLVEASEPWRWPEGQAPSRGVVLANVDAPVLESHAAALASVLPPRGRLVLSGMLDERAPAVEAAVLAAGEALGRRLFVAERTSLDGWTALDLRSAEPRSVA